MQCRGRAERVDRPARPGIARSHLSEAVVRAHQKATEVEAPVYLAPRQAQQGAQEDRVLPQVTALQVCDGLEGVDTTHLRACA